MIQSTKISAILCLTLTFLAGSASGQIQDIRSATELVTWTTRAEPDIVLPGGNFFAVVDATIAEDWKMYALDSSLPPAEQVLSRPYGVKFDWGILPTGVAQVGDMHQDAPEEGYDENFELDLKFFHERARFVTRIDVESDAVDGLQQMDGSVQFQICNDELGICLSPTTVPVSFTFQIDSNCSGPDCTAADATLAELILTTRAPANDSSPSKRSGLVSTTTDFDASRSRGFWAFILLAVGAGLASLLTPCVFPMIPLTVSYFTKHADDRPQALRMASLFGSSIIVTFTGIGVLAAAVVGAAGAQRIASNPWVNLFIAVVLVGFALSLLGLFELRLPSGLVNYFDRQGTERSGIVGVLFMGLTLTLVSFSCTAPFVGGLLAAASSGTWMYPLLGMIAYSATFALPFILLAMFPNALNALPRSGSWMNVVKVVLGFIELAAAVKFLSNADLIWGWGLVSRPLGIAFVLVIFALAGLYLLGRLRLAHDVPVESIGVGRMMGAVLFFVLALYLLPGLLGAPLNRLDAYLPPRQATDVSILSLLQTSGSTAPASNDEGWIVDEIDQAFKEATLLNRPVFIDFSGYTCTNCREMEANVFPRPPIMERLTGGFVLLRLYTDGLDLGAELSRFQLRLTGTVALPTYAIVEPTEQELIARWSGMMDPDDFASFLDSGLATFRRLTLP